MNTMWHSLRLLVALMIVACVVAPGCSKKEEAKAPAASAAATDQAAAAEAQSHEAHESEAKDEQLLPTPDDLKALTSEATMQKVMLMPHRLADRLMGEDHTITGTVEHTIKAISEQNEQNATTARETQTVSFRHGDGAFRIRFAPHTGFGLEMIRIGDEILNRYRDGEWVRGDSKGKDIFFYEKATGTMERFYRYFAGYMTFTPGGEDTLGGRAVKKVNISFDQKGHEFPQPLPITTRTTDKFRLGIKAGNKSIANDRTKVSGFTGVSGTLWVDPSTGVALKGQMEGSFNKPGVKNSTIAFNMKYEFAWDLGKAEGIVRPADKDIVEQAERRSWNRQDVLKGMPKDLMEKSGVMTTKPLTPAATVPAPGSAPAPAATPAPKGGN